ncbi:MAG: DUF885 family protein [Pseudomonadota bacterium]|nr:DUF885 family protein [Pseudomonadota bacterium]
MTAAPRPLATLGVAISLALAVAGCASTPPSMAPEQAAAVPATASASPRAERLDALYARYWEEVLALNPLQATFQGDPRYNDQLPNFLAPEYRERSRAFTRRWLDTVQAVGADGLQGQDLLSYQIFVRNAEKSLEAEQFPGWQQPVNQFYNIAATAVQLGTGSGAQPFKTVQDYDNWRKRAANLPAIFDQAIANSRVGMQNGVVQPRALMVKVLPQLDALIKDRAEESLFWVPVKTLPASFPAAERERITREYRTMVEAELIPAYRRLRSFVADEYMPATRTSAGLSALPGGEAWYAFNARNSTTTDLSPAQIHQIGLDEVARLHGEIRKVMAEVGFKGTLQEFFRFMQDDPRFTFESEEALLAYYRGLEAVVDRHVDKLFSLTPRAGFEIRPVEAFRAQSAAGGSYMRPSEDGTRPGIFYVNTYDLPTRKTWDAEDLYLHEAVPGHHYQIALQQEITGLPAFRRFGGETAYIEGWGLYAESLGKDLGLYTDPYNYFGYLQNELWRAIRLVVDTGLHSKGWTREQVIKYMLDNSAESETQAIAEAERYMAIPGQALAYKIGELKIQELRARAETQLGPRFDIREFHAEVLKDGSVPLDVLEAKIERWISAQKG